MSTKQIVIFTFMIIFLAVMLFALGSWFHYSTELEIKTKALDAVKLKNIELSKVLDGDASKPGLKKIILDPADGLAAKLSSVKALADAKQTEAQDGPDSRRILYENMEPQLNEKWPVAEATWKKLYLDWESQNKNIAQADERMKAQFKEKDTKVAEAQADLKKALEDEDTKRKEAAKAYKDHSEELTTVRNDEEEIINKVTQVTREIRSPKNVVPQGKIIQASEPLKIVTINLGSVHGIRKGLQFDVYSGVHQQLVKKGRIEVSEVKATSSFAVILPPPVEKLIDPLTGWQATDPRMKYSVFSAGGPDENQAQLLIKPKSKAERLESIRLEKIEREQGLEARQKAEQEGLAPTHPPLDLGVGFVPIAAGDWINNTDFTPIVSEQEYRDKTTNELLSMETVNVSALTFYFTDVVPPYRKEFLKRLCERNHCRTADAMTADVNYVVTTATTMRSDLLKEELDRKDNKDKDTVIMRQLHKTLEAEQEGDKIGAGRIAEDELEAFFAKRQRKMELLRGKTTQPGQSTFFIAGETRDRSVPHLQHYIADHGGLVATELTDKVDYVVAGGGLDKAFYENLKKLGVKIIREDELPDFFGQSH